MARGAFFFFPIGGGEKKSGQFGRISMFLA
jgi:hypothetical protein